MRHEPELGPVDDEGAGRPPAAVSGDWDLPVPAVASVRVAAAEPAEGAAARRVWSRPLLALLLVGLLFALAQVLLVTLARDLENDEAVYLSQVSRFTARAPWEAHRAWGMPLLLLPVGLATESVLAMRVELLLVSAAGLVLAFLPWLRVLPGATAPLAALLFCSTWVTLFYASEASPNLPLALAAVAALGNLSRLLEAPGNRRALVGVVVATALGALVRPTDSLWIALPGLVVAAAAPRWRWRAGAALLAGLALGWLPWLVEAYLTFGGPLARYHEAQVPAGSSGVGFTLLKHLRLTDGGRTCCFGADRVPNVPIGGLLWWSGLCLLAVLGPVLARGRAERRGLGLALASGVAVGLAYLILTGFVASRFLLPTYALLALPAAASLVAVLRRTRRHYWRGGLTLAAVLGVLGAHLGWHAGVASFLGHHEQYARAPFPVIADGLRARGLSAPCQLLGARSQNIAYHAGCVSGRTGSRHRDLRNPAAADSALRAGYEVGFLWSGELPRGSYLRQWIVVPLPEAGRGWRVYVPPSASWLTTPPGGPHEPS